MSNYCLKKKNALKDQFVVFMSSSGEVAHCLNMAVQNGRLRRGVVIYKRLILWKLWQKHNYEYIPFLKIYHPKSSTLDI